MDFFCIIWKRCTIYLLMVACNDSNSISFPYYHILNAILYVYFTCSRCNLFIRIHIFHRFRFIPLRLNVIKYAIVLALTLTKWHSNKPFFHSMFDCTVMRKYSFNVFIFFRGCSLFAFNVMALNYACPKLHHPRMIDESKLLTLRLINNYPKINLSVFFFKINNSIIS